MQTLTCSLKILIQSGTMITNSNGVGNNSRTGECIPLYSVAAFVDSSEDLCFYSLNNKDFLGLII